MAKLAVDIVILPPAEIADKVIAFNQQIGGLINQDRQERFPHISLAMGVLEESEIQEVRQKLVELFKEPILVTEAEVALVPERSINGHWVSIQLGKTEALARLHKAIIRELRVALKSSAPTKETLLETQVAPVTLQFIENYIPKSSYDAYNPHITAGLVTDSLVLPEYKKEAFMANTLAICQLGNYCTCRKPLAKIEV